MSSRISETPYHTEPAGVRDRCSELGPSSDVHATAQDAFSFKVIPLELD